MQLSRASFPPEMDIFSVAQSFMEKLPQLPLARMAPWCENENINFATEVKITTSFGSKDLNFGYYVQYDIELTCPWTTLTWTLSKRYSEVLCFWEKLGNFSAFAKEIAYITQLPFPKKYFDSERPKVLAIRMHHFKCLFSHFWSLALYLLYTQELSENLSTILNELQCFLEIPEAILKTEFSANQPLEEQCAICLDAFNTSTALKVLKMRCNHAYHAACLSEWFERSKSCPLCRCPLERITVLCSVEKEV